MDTLRLLSCYVGYNGALEKEGELKSDAGTLSVSTLARFIAGKGSKSIAGIDNPQVDEWLSWGAIELTPLVDEKLFKLNDHLASRTFLVGNDITLADVVVFGLVLPAAAKFPAAQTLHFSSLLRWADLIQSLIGGPSATKAVYGYSLVLDKPRFKPPVLEPPPVKAAPAAPAAPAANGKAEGKAAPAPNGKAESKAAPAAPASSDQPKNVDAAPAAAPNKEGGGKKSDAKAVAAGGGKSSDASVPKEGGKKESKAGGGAEKKAEDEEPSIGLLDIRVGTIVKVGKHPNADSLYLEEIDLGEDKPRQIISGLVKFVPEEKMLGRRVAVVCNLKPAKMREVMSYGMVLCASNEDHTCVDPVEIPEGVPNGERVEFAGYPGPPLDEVNPKKKILERLFPDMKTDGDGMPNFKGAKFMTSKGPLKASIPNAHVA